MRYLVRLHLLLLLRRFNARLVLLFPDDGKRNANLGDVQRHEDQHRRRRLPAGQGRQRGQARIYYTVLLILWRPEMPQAAPSLMETDTVCGTTSPQQFFSVVFW